MTYLLLSIVALGFGPILHRSAQRLRGMLSGLDGFVFVAVGGLVAFKLLPHSIAEAGWGAAVAAVFGFTILNIVERLASYRGSGTAARRVRAFALVVAATGVALHELLDGVALATSTGGAHAEHVLPAAIILHRIPIGMTLWWLIRPGYGRMAAWAALLGVAAATAFGYAMGEQLAAVGDGHAVGLVQGLVSGSLLHLALHRTEPEGGEDNPLAAGVGAILAIALVLAVREAEATLPVIANELGAEATFVTLALGIAPWFVLAALGNVLLQRLVPTPVVASAARGPAGLLDGWRRLAETSPTGAMLALVAVPLLGIDALVAAVALLGDRFALLRMVGAVVLVGLVALAFSPKVAPTSDEGRASPSPAWRVGLLDFVGHHAPWLLVGLTVAALVEPFVPADALTGVPVAAQLLVAVLLGLRYVPAFALLPIAAVFLHKGGSVGAVMTAFLLAPVPTRDIFGRVATLHGWRTALRFDVVLIAGAVLVGMAAERLTPGGFPLHDRIPSIWEWAGAGVAALLTLVALLRKGPRGLFQEVVPEAHDHGKPGEPHESA